MIPGVGHDIIPCSGRDYLKLKVELLRTEKGVFMNYDDFLELARKRRSIRKFKSDPVPDEYIDRIIEVAPLGPPGGNSQPREFIVVRKKELKDRIPEVGKGQDAIPHKM